MVQDSSDDSMQLVQRRKVVVKSYWRVFDDRGWGCFAVSGLDCSFYIRARGPEEDLGFGAKSSESPSPKPEGVGPGVSPFKSLRTLCYYESQTSLGTSNRSTVLKECRRQVLRALFHFSRWSEVSYVRSDLCEVPSSGATLVVAQDSALL